MNKLPESKVKVINNLDVILTKRVFVNSMLRFLLELDIDSRDIALRLLLGDVEFRTAIKRRCMNFIPIMGIPSFIEILINGDFSKESYSVAKDDILSDIYEYGQDLAAFLENKE